MKGFSTLILTATACLLLLSSSGFTGEPTEIPWPIGYSEAEMHFSRDLWRTYGNINGTWDDDGNFHPGIDIANNTEVLDGCDEVRCVKAGYVTDIYPEALNGSDADDHLLVICDEPPGSADYGWCYQHLKDHGWEEGDEVPYAVLISTMHPDVGQPHLHFMWTDAVYQEPYLCYVNPLNYLNPAPLESEGFIWTWNPEGNDPPYEYFFLPYMWYEDWANLSVSDTFDAMLDESYLSGHVDFFLGQYLSGIGMASGQAQAPWLAPRRIKWDVVREKPSGDEITQTRYVMDFDCVLAGPGDSRYQMHYFRHYMDDMYGQGIYHYGSLSCLTNCGDAEGWEDLGIDNILNSSWKTNEDCIGEDDTLNPVLAAFQDGPYRIDVESYTYDLSDMYPVEIDIELHNFDPVVREVIITGNTDEVVWHAKWMANDLVPELMILINNSVAPGQTLDATVIFTEPMNTSSGTYNITAGKAPGYNDLTVTTTGWSCTDNSEPYYDTWSGTVTVPAEGYSGWISLKVEAEDTDGNCLKDPAGAFGDDEYSDLYHGFGMAFGPEPGWPVALHGDVYGSPVLGDLDGDGDLDVAIQSRDGWVHLLDDDGNSLNSNWPMHSGGWGSINVYASPSIVDLDGDGDIDVLSVNTIGCHARDVVTGSSISGWPVEMGGSSAPGFYPSYSSPAIGDVDGDGNVEVVICRHLSGSTILQPTVYLYEHSGGSFTWCRNLEPSLGGSSVIITPAIGDVSSSHPGNEIVVCTAEGFQTTDEDDSRDFNSAVYLLDPSDGENIWKTSFNCWFYASPVVADVDSDGVNEIIVGTSGGSDTKKVIVLNGNTGAVEHIWNVGGWVMGPAGIGDINGDGHLDIAVGVNGGMVECWSGEDYQSLPGFPVAIGSNPSRGVSIADIDSDQELEIVVGTLYGLLYTINSDGSICTGYPVDCADHIKGQPAIGELDGDGHLELVFADSDTPTAYCYDLGENSFPAFTPWRQFQHDSWHSGFYEADNTVPAPPTNLTGEITYPPEGHFIVDLEWDLSVNDPLSSNPQDPADVVFYCIYIEFPPFTPCWIVGRTHAGDNTFTHEFNAGYPKVRYVVTAHDGTNESVESNEVCFHTSGRDNIALGCSVREEIFSTETSQRLHRETAADRRRIDSGSEISEESAGITPYSGNPGILTDGRTDEVYRPSSDAAAVVIDLGEECSVSSVITDRAALTFSDESAQVDESPVQSACAVEVAGDNREYEPFDAELSENLSGVRYIRVTGAAGMTEISIYGSRPGEETCMAVEISRSSSSDGWAIRVPVSESSDEVQVRIFDLAGRMIWSGNASSGTVLHWDGLAGGTAVPFGVYLVQCTSGDEVSTGRLVVRE